MLEMEDERELRDEVSEIMDSGEENTDVVFASEDRRTVLEYGSWEEAAARHWSTAERTMVQVCALRIAKHMEFLRDREYEPLALTAGVAKFVS